MTAWCGPSAHNTAYPVITAVATREAPRRSARLRRTFSRAIHAATKHTATMIEITTAFSEVLSDEPAVVVAVRPRVHGPRIQKETGRPRNDAASTRTRTSGRSGSGPSHAFLTSAKLRGVQSGSTG